MPLLLNADGLPVASIFVMANNSMFPNLHQNDILIVDNNVPFDSLRIGDIIAYKTFGTTGSGQHIIVAHRVAQIVTDSQGQKIVRAKGDANADSIPSLDYPIFQQNYIGKVVYVLNSNDTSALTGLLSNLSPSLSAR
jgi:signal peptidase I